MTSSDAAPGASTAPSPSRSAGAAEIVSRLAGAFPDIESASVGTAPAPRMAQGAWLYATVRVADDDVHPLEPLWEADALLGAAAEEVASAGAASDVLRGSEVTFDASGQDPEPYYGAVGLVAATQSFSGPTETAEVDSLVRATLSEFGVTPERVSVYEANGPNVAVVGSIASEDVLAGNLGRLESQLTGNGTLYPALYLEIRLDDVAVAKLASAYRTGTGSQWVDLRYEALFGGPAHG